MDAKWYRLARYDSAVVSMPDGTSAALYQRDPEQFRDLLKRTARDPPAAPPRVAASWPSEYRAALGEITSPEAWEETFRPSRPEASDE